MTDCREYILDDLTAITVIPLSNIPAGDPLSAANSLAPYISADGFSPSLAGAVTIGRQPAQAGGALVPIVKDTGKVKDDEGDSVAGRLHTVTVTCEADDRGQAPDGSGRRVYDYLLALERTPGHLLLTLRDGRTKAFVSATRDTYTCETERDGSKTAVTFRIQNIMGIQFIV